MNGPSPAFVELSDIEYTRLRKALLRSKGSDTQRDFLEDVRDTDTFLQRMARIPTTGTETAPVIPDPLTESEFKEPAPIIEQILYETWSALPPATACRSTFWAHVTLEHLRQGRIQSSYLAANGGSLPGGLERIDHVLADTSDRAPRLIDLCVRTVLRRLGGLPEIRGNRSVYVDCPFARAWWRERWVDHASQGDPQLARHLRDVVRSSQTYWEKFIDRVVFRNSTFGDESLRSAFLRALAQFARDNPGTKFLQTEGIQRLCRRATTYQGRLELSILDDDELNELMAAMIANS